MSYNDIFRDFLNGWIKANWRGNYTEFAEFIGLSRQGLSNILRGYRAASEQRRIAICKKLGVDYSSLIKDMDGKEDKNKVVNSTVTQFPKKMIDPKLEALKADLSEIYEYGNPAMIAAIEMGIASLKASIQMEKKAKKRAVLSLVEENESLIDPPAPGKKRGPLAKGSN